jgi:hypothetical protein
MCEPYDWDEEKQDWIYKDLFQPKVSPIVLGNDEEGICEYINNHIEDLKRGDIGAMHIWEGSDGTKVVDIEWNDGFSGFRLKDVIDFIEENESVTKEQLMEFTY